MKEEREILSGIDAPLKKRQGGGHNGPPPGKLGLMLWAVFDFFHEKVVASERAVGF